MSKTQHDDSKYMVQHDKKIVKYFAAILFTSTYLAGSGIHAIGYTWYYYIPEGQNFGVPLGVLALMVFPCIFYAILADIVLPYSLYTNLFRPMRIRVMDWIWTIQTVIIIWIMQSMIAASAVTLTIVWFDCRTVPDNVCHQNNFDERLIQAQFFNSWVMTIVGIAHAIVWTLMYNEISERITVKKRQSK